MSDYISKSKLKEISEIQKGDFNSVESIRAWIDSQPTLDEKEIIRKAFERVIQQLSEQMPIRFNGFGKTLITVEDVIKIVKEECGISE